MLHADALASFMYHEVTDDPTSTGFQRRGARPYTCTPATFEAHLDLIAARGHTPALVSWIDLAAPRARVVLTFDDGGRSALKAAEALNRRGWRAHFFVVTQRIGTRGFVDGAAIRALHAAGHVVGSHSHTHPDIFPQLTPRAMLDEWRTSRDILEQLLGARCRVASLPGGDLSDEVATAATAAGLDVLFTSEPILTPMRRSDNSCWLVGRHAVTRSLRIDTMRELLGFRGWRRALLARQCSVLARRTLGPLYRAYVAHSTAGDRAPERAS